jgi:hypothetical protein
VSTDPRRIRLFDIYKTVFEMIDEEGMREARHYVQDDMEMDAYSAEKENWLEIESPAKHRGEDWKLDKERAERVARAFDRLGLMVREGRVPINMVARFYSRPTLLCWQKLSPYIRTQRQKRKQPGHMWEWENLVFEILIPGLRVCP